MLNEQLQTIAQVNETIALFMGHERYEDQSGVWFKREGLIMCMHPRLQDLQYHSDWSWLMPVVDKIESMGHKTIIGGGDHWGHYCNIMFNLETPDGDTKALGQGKTKIEAVYKAVCDFIHWYKTEALTPKTSTDE